MQFQNENLDLSTHTFLDFDTDGGRLSVNVSNKQIQLAHSDISFGKGTFEMNVSHIYSNVSHILDSNYGKNWKLNIEQYILPYSTSMALNGFNVGDYVYIDGKGLIHRFVKYDTAQYYDVSGNNAILDTSQNIKIMRFPDDSFLSFDSKGRLTEFTTKGRSRDIIKRITYDSNGCIEKYFDIRCPGKKERYVKFEYDKIITTKNDTEIINYLLKRMYLFYIDKEIESVYYKYKKSVTENDNYNLIGIYHYINQNLASVSLFNYNRGDDLFKVTGTPNGNAISLYYTDSNITLKQGISKILLDSNYPNIGEDNKSYETYVSLDEKIYLNNNLFLVSGINNLEELEQSLSSKELEVTETIMFTYNSSYTDVKNSKEVTHRYYFNTDGEVTSQFEVDGNSLRTLYQETGYCAMKNMEKGYSGFTINQKRAVSRNIGIPIDCLDKNLEEEDFKGRNYEKYRKDKFYHNIHFKVGFFVKHNCNNATYMKAIFYYKDAASKEEKIAIDCKATNAWQYVEIPFSLTNDDQAKSSGLSQGRIKIVSDGTGTYEVSDIRFYEIEGSFIYLNSEGKHKPIKNFYSINLELSNGTKQKLLMDQQYFLSDSDLILNWLNSERKNDGKFDFVCCNGKKRYKVKNVSFQDKSCNDIESLCTHIFPFNNITFQTKDVLDNLITESFSIYADGIIITNTNIFGECNSSTHDQRDLQGRVLYSVDSYGKKTVNEYDNYGNLLSTIIAKEDDFGLNGKISEGKKCLYLLYGYVEEKEEFRENISSIKNEEGTIKFSYDDLALNQCNSSQTNDKIKTNYVYDCINRLCEISQEEQKNHISYDSLGAIKSYSDNSSYEYEISNDFNKSTVAIKTSNDKHHNLCDTTIYYESNSVIQKYTMLGTYLLTSYNKYGKTTNYNYAKTVRQIVNITYQEIGDTLSSDGLTNYFDGSLSAASIKQIKCPFTGNTYYFNYNNANQLKEYIMKNEDTVLLSIKKEDELSTKYNVGGKEYVTTKEYNKNPLQNRIIKTKNGESSDSDFSKFTYSYEYHSVLGTITKKTGGNSSREISYDNQDNSSYYSSNPQKIIQKYGNTSFDIVYNYNQSNDIIKVFGHSSLPYLSCSYSYDKNHRIAKEGYIKFNVDYSYEYNEFNRLSKVYMNKELYKDFTYDSLGRLTNVEGYGTNSIIFDYNENNLYPSAINGNTCKFNRNGLLYMYGDNTYEYDYLGLRYSKKTSNGVTVKYYYLGDKLLGEDYSNGVKIRYMYDLEGIAGARYYNGSEVTEYEYVKDGYNNVIAIMKGDTIVAKYVYDAWGNTIREERPNINEPFAKINPIRYRSYYYDIETKLYYLQTRYYNPEIGAFISPDSTDYLDVKKISGLNLYTYCYNNPVMYYDPSGHFPFLVLTMLIGAAIGGAIAGTTAYAHGARGWKLFGWTALGVLAGGAIGALAGAGISVLLTGKALSSITAVYYGFKALAWAYTLGGATGAVEFMMYNVNEKYVPYYYPMNEGFETMYQMTLQPGDVIQRFGGEGSPYVAPYFTDPFSLSLPYKQLPNIYNPNLYVVTKPIVVTAGPAAPWFGQYGGGTQYVLPNTIENLIGDCLKVLQ